MNRANELESFEIVRVQRNQIHGAPYNPRKIKPENAQNLEEVIKELGILESPVLNKRSKEKGWTGGDIGKITLVGFHRRIERMDEILQRDDYIITAHLVDLSPKDEVKANIALNNPKLQGEWDYDRLNELKASFPELDFGKDLFLDDFNIKDVYDDSSLDVSGIMDPLNDIDFGDFSESESDQKPNKPEEEKKRPNDIIQPEIKNDNYIAYLVFKDNEEKERDFKKLGLSNAPEDAYINASILYDIYDHKIHLRELS